MEFGTEKEVIEQIRAQISTESVRPNMVNLIKNILILEKIGGRETEKFLIEEMCASPFWSQMEDHDSLVSFFKSVLTDTVLSVICKSHMRQMGEGLDRRINA